MKKVSSLDKPALVICNGEPPSRALTRRLAHHTDLIVAADGGANIARAYGIRPHLIIGDLDSISKSTRHFFSSSTILHVNRQDNTDLEKALDYLVSQKIRKAVIIGATGKRIDFTLGNLSVLWAYTSLIDLTFVGDGWKAIPVVSRMQLRAPIGTTVSLIPFGRCSGITLRGLQYPLTNASMNVGEIGVSNVVSSSSFTVHVKKGHMLLLVMDTVRKVRRRT
jgi:thiamine pyrophosphokinase